MSFLPLPPALHLQIYEELFHTVKYTPVFNDFNCFNPFNCIYTFFTLSIRSGPCCKLAIC